MADPDAPRALAPLREGMKTVMAEALARVARDAWRDPAAAGSPPGPPAGALAAQLEAAVHAAARPGGRPGGRSYAASAAATLAALGVQTGPFPDDVPALRFARGLDAAAAVVAAAAAPPPPPDPREAVRRMLTRTLLEADARYAADRPRALAAARAVEASCFNAAVRLSKEAEDPPRRQWDSAAFVDIYGGRCGAVASLLDASSSACRAYGAAVVPRLLDGSLAPEALGDLSTAALCPAATAAERAEVARRIVQKVARRESNLFRCPHCGERRCSYQEIQRRSLDEGADCLCLCLSCNRRFTGHN